MLQALDMTSIWLQDYTEWHAHLKVKLAVLCEGENTGISFGARSLSGLSPDEHPVLDGMSAVHHLVTGCP